MSRSCSALDRGEGVVALGVCRFHAHVGRLSAFEAVPVTVDVDQERSNSFSYHTRMPSRPTVVVLSVRLRRARCGPARSASMHVAGPGGDQTERDGVLTEVCSTVVWSGVLCVRWK